jgi:hypothetical protein
LEYTSPRSSPIRLLRAPQDLAHGALVDSAPRHLLDRVISEDHILNGEVTLSCHDAILAVRPERVITVRLKR